MAFSRETRISALVASARHCCVCHRYKGVKVEVHHIVPKNEGGNDDFDNAIALCFDCHADAGHYNERHPRGNKFSVEELRASRDRWYNLVQEKHIKTPSEPDVLYCRYLICKDWEVLREIASHDLSKLPFPNMILLNNYILDFLRRILSSHTELSRITEIVGKSYSGETAYKKAFPYAVRVDKSSPDFPYFEFIRILTESELKCLAKKDGVTRLLINAGILANEIAVAISYIEVCGEETFQELFRLRPLWGIFLAITNITESTLTLESLEGIFEDNNIPDYRSFSNDPDIIEEKLELPLAPIGRDMTVLVPLGIALAPFNHISEDIGYKFVKEIEIGRGQELAHVLYPEDAVKEFHIWGPLIRPTRIEFKIGEVARFQEVHELDLTNLYTIDRIWLMGCCPHLFFLHDYKGMISYEGELFNHMPGFLSQHEIRIPDYVTSIIIAELENEHTFIASASCNGIDLFRNIELWENEFVEKKVPKNSLLMISGFYILEHKIERFIKTPWVRNRLIGNFLSYLPKVIKY